MRSRLDCIDTLRGLAALGVVICHVTSALDVSINRVGDYGGLGVEVFFVISGFVITYSLWSHEYSMRQFPRYMIRRALRLEPPYLASVALSIVVQVAVQQAPAYRGSHVDISTVQIVYNLFYLIPFTDYDWLNPSYWTLAYEFAFYIIVGLTFGLFARRNAAFTILFAIAVLIAKRSLTAEWDYQILTFVVGILAMRYAVGLDQRPEWFTWTIGCVAAIAMIGSFAEAAAVALTALIIVASRDVQFGRRLTMIGTISYSMYLTHEIVALRVVNLGMRLGAGMLFQLMLLGLSILIAIIFAAIFWKVFEAPALKISRSFRSTPSTVATP